MTNCVPKIGAIGFDLIGAIRFFREHLAEPGADLAAVRLPAGGWLALDPEAGELRDGAREVAQ